MEKRIPRRRFKEFIGSGEWEEKKLGEIYTFLKGKSLRLDSFYEGVDNPSIAYGHLYTIYNEVIEEVTLSSSQKGIESKKGDVLFPGSSTVPFGTAQANAMMIDGVNLGGDIIVAREESKRIYAPFISYQINSQKEKLYPITVGTTITHMYGKDLAHIKYCIPSLAEQEKIGYFFQKLDRLIEVNREKLDKLKASKSAYLTEMFPGEGEDRPRRRFQGFTGPWEEMKLGEVANYRRGSFPQPYGKKEWYDGEGSKPFVQVVDVNNNLELVDKTKQKISILAQPKSVFVKKGTVIVTLQGSIGRVAITQYDSYLDRTILIFESYNKKIEKVFWAYVIQKKFREEKESAPGATIKTITIAELSKFIVNIPSYKEQEKIGNFFKKLDQQIEVQEERLEKLEKMKKAYLAEMFV